MKQKISDAIITANRGNSPPTPSKAIKDAVLAGLSMAMEELPNLSWYPGDKEKNDEVSKSLTFLHYDTYLGMMMNSWSAFKKILSSPTLYDIAGMEVESISTHPLPLGSYSLVKFNAAVVGELMVPYKKPGAPDKYTLTVDNQSFDFNSWMPGVKLARSLMQHGIFLACRDHVTSVKQIAAMFTGFKYRLKEVWFQEKEVKLGKDTGDLNESLKLPFKMFGVNAMYYQFFGMLNYPKQLKSTLRRQVGVGTNLVDLILYYRRIQTQLDRENEKIERALRYQLRFWTDAQCRLIFDFIKEKANDENTMASFCNVFLNVLSMKQPTQDYKFFFPACILVNKKIDLKKVDFSAQGAWRTMNILGDYGLPSPSLNDDLRYAILLAITGFNFADQRLVTLLFQIKPKTRSDINSPFPKSTKKVGTLKLPKPAYWTKMYKGQAGIGGMEQKSVLHPIAGTITYKGSDFILTTKTIDSDFRGYGTNAFAFLEREQLKCTAAIKDTSVTYGSQLIHPMSTLSETGEIEDGYKIQARGHIICFYSSMSGNDQDQSRLSIGEMVGGRPSTTNLEKKRKTQARTKALREGMDIDTI